MYVALLYIDVAFARHHVAFLRLAAPLPVASLGLLGLGGARWGLGGLGAPARGVYSIALHALSVSLSHSVERRAADRILLLSSSEAGRVNTFFLLEGLS